MASDDDADDYVLPLEPSIDALQLAAQLGAQQLGAIDANILRHALPRRPLKVASVLFDAMKAGGFLPADNEREADARFELHMRRLMALVEAGSLVGLGNLRKPGRSEVLLPEQA